MSLRSHPDQPTPDHPDPVTRNQPDADEVQAISDSAGNGEQKMPGGYPLSPEAKATPPDEGLIDQSVSGTDLKEEIADAKQGRDKDSVEDEWGIEKGADKDF